MFSNVNNVVKRHNIVIYSLQHNFCNVTCRRMSKSKSWVTYVAMHSEFFILFADLLQQRLKNLREIAKKLADDNWRYTSIEHLIGRD